MPKELLSRSWRQAQPGCLVVSTRHAGITDEVIHGKTGYLVEERDVVGMKNHLCALLRDKALCRKLGENARAHMRANFSLKRHIACLQEIVDAGTGWRAKS